MSNPNFIHILPFKIELNANETKKYYFTNDIKEFIINYSSNMKIRIKLLNSFGDEWSDFITSGRKIDINNFTTIIFSKIENDTIIILDN